MKQISDRDPLEELAEEFLSRYRNGERPSIAEYVDRRPELADDVRASFPALVMMEDLAASGDASAPLNLIVDEAAPERLGDYRILREIGRGGMGVVYEAEQMCLQRRVALKVLPLSALRTANSQKRFLREAQSAAKLHHTNIVPVFGVGEDRGLHYYAMQFIEGRGLDRVIQEMAAGPSATKRRVSVSDRPPLSAFCEAPGKSLPSSACQDEAARAVDSSASERRGSSPPTADTATSRLSDTAVYLSPLTSPVDIGGHAKPPSSYVESVARIGVQVADALEHSHSQGILHRDIKPGNLILDYHGTVWVTDFGLARSEDDEDVTGTGEIVGTLRYSAPEQIEHKEDFRSDIYSLGLTLYELLAQRPAFSEQNRNRLAQQVMRGDIRPLRKIDPQIPRDLETIVHKAVRSVPNDRYQTAAELAADLRRFLNNEPIHARRVTVSERVWRWCRRNPVVTGSVAISTFAIMLTLAVAIVSISRAKDRAEESAVDEHNSRVAAEAALIREQDQKNESEAISNLLLDMFALAHPERANGRDVTVREMVDIAAARVGARFTKQPEKEAAYRHAIGIVYYKLGLHVPAHKQWTAALTLRRHSLGAEHLSTLKTQQNLAANHHRRGELNAGRELEEDALEILLRVYGRNHEATLEMLGNIGARLYSEGKYAQALKQLEDVYERKLRVLGPEHRSTLITMSNLAVALKKLQRLERSEKLNRRALEAMQRVLGGNHPNTLITLGNLARILSSRGEYSEAEAINRHVLSIRRRILGSKHPLTLAVQLNLDENLESLRNDADAKRLHRVHQKIYEAMKQAHGPEHPKTLMAANNLAWSTHSIGEDDEARRNYENLLETAIRVLGANHPDTKTFRRNLSKIPQAQKKPRESRRGPKKPSK